jgi:hypothetical protein
MLSICPTQRTRSYFAVVREWPERTEAFQAQLVYYAAKRLHEELLQRIPSAPEWEEYRKALEVAQVNAVVPAFAVRLNSRRSGVREVDGSVSVLYIEPRRRMAKTHPGVAVLEKYSPWTAEALPFTPKRNEARLVVRKVTPKEVEQVRKDRRRDKSKWQRELARAGVRLKLSDKRNRQQTAVPDIAFEGLRLEFGMGGQNAKPHWRPALRQIAGGMQGILKAHSTLTFAFTRASYQGWRSWPARVQRHITPAEAAKYIPFAERLGSF